MIIAQLSDLHVCEPGTHYRQAASSNDMARAAVAQLNALDPPADRVIVTGDLTEDGLPSQYAEAQAILGALRAPLVVLPGNHDDREVMRRCLTGHDYFPAAGPVNFVIDDGPVRLIAIDVTVPDAHHGEVADATLAWLAAMLEAGRDRPTILAMHQPPFACGVPYLDQYRCFAPDRLGALVARHATIERVICGHVHRSMVRRWSGTVVMTCPSTATQIALALRPDAVPASYLEPPGYLLHHWSAATGLVTHVCPIGRFAGPFPFA